MAIRTHFEIQGHRGARGLLPENTLPSFEIALDVGVDAIETDVHLTRDDVPILFHDPRITDRLCPQRGTTATPLVRSLTLEQLRALRVGDVGSSATPVAKWFGADRGLALFGIPTLADLFDFVNVYAGPVGADLGKTPAQREQARALVFDLELKRVPFEPETIGDGFDGIAPGTLEEQVLRAVRDANVQARTRLRSFDHRSLRAARRLEPALRIALLVHHTAPTTIGEMLRLADAELYCPDYTFVDAEVVQQVHAMGKRIIPYTVNDPREWERLLAWGVDGVTTDHPERLASWLTQREGAH